MLLAGLLPRYLGTLGISQAMLDQLSWFPVALISLGFAGFYLALKKKESWRPAMRLVSIGNLVYAAVVLGSLASQHPTKLGLAYFAIDALVVALIAIVEMKLSFTRV